MYSYSVRIKDIITDDGKKYYIIFNSTPINEDHPDYKGFNTIGLRDAEDDVDEKSYYIAGR